MQRAMSVIGLFAFVAARAAGQWLGMPSWNSPKGGRGVGIAADYGQPNADAGKGSAYGGRVSFGAGSALLTVGAASWKPEDSSARVTSFRGSLQARLIGGSLLPVAVNLQLGGAYHAKVTSGTQTLPGASTAQGAVGLSTPLLVPLIRLEPYFSPGVRYHRDWNAPAGSRKEETNFGGGLGGNAGFGAFGGHLAYDSEKVGDGTTHVVIGIGARLEVTA